MRNNISLLAGSKKSSNAILRKKNALAAAALLAALGLVFLWTGLKATTKGTPVEPQFPSKQTYEESAQAGQEELDSGFLNDLTGFSFVSASLVLSSLDETKNALYSPASLYMALAAAAQGAQGQTRKELLQAMQIRDPQLMDEQTGKLFRRLYVDNEIGRLTLSTSLWLGKDGKYKSDFLQSAANTCYAHIMVADFASEETANTMAQWAAENTGDKLDSEPLNIATHPLQCLTLLSAVSFCDEWWDEFDAKKTVRGEFTLSDGVLSVCEYMNAAYVSHPFVDGEGYLTSALRFKNGQSMVFVLSDAGVLPYEILSDPTILEKAVNAISSETVQTGEVIFKIPKFAFRSSLNLVDSLKVLGVKEAFYGGKANFASISDAKPLFLSDVAQSAAISIDEKGCQANACTQIAIAGAALRERRVEMTLDRPFLFAITGKAGGVPLFVGIVNNPAA